MGKLLPGKKFVGFFRCSFIFLLLLAGKKSFGQQGGISGIYTDYQGFWSSSSTAINPIKPDNDHNVIGFSWNGTTYSTGVNNAALTANGVSFSPVVFQAFPVRNIALTGSSRIILGQLKDGVDNGASTPAPFTSPPQISNFLTDGIQGLNIGTGVIDVPASTPLTFDFGAIIDVNKINDGIPDLLISQVGYTVAGTPADNVYFVDANGNRVGNIVSIDQSQVPFVGNWTADLYDLNGTLPASYTKTDRQIRVWAADVSVFGINASNYATVTALKYELKGYSDPAFLAFNTSIIQILSANDDAASTNMATAVAIPVLDNDVPSTAIDASSVTVTTPPQHGSYSISSTGVITYTPVAGFFGTDNFVYRMSNNGNSQSDIAQVIVTVGGPVAAPVFGPGLTASRCAGAGTSAYTATATNSTGIVYTLSPAAAGSIDASSGLVTWAATFSGTATVTATASGQGGPQSSTYTVTVNPIPDAPTVNNETICNGSNTTLTATAPGGTYNWYDAASGGALLFTGASFATPNLTSTVTYYVDATSAAGCTSPRAAVTVTVNPIPSAPTASNATVCSWNTATLTATAPGGTYNWYDSASGGMLLFTGASFTTPNLTNTVTYYVDATVNGCTSSRAAVTVTVNLIPSAPTASNATVCSGNTATLTATAPGGTYEWFDAASGGVSLSNNASFTTPFLSSTTTYYVQTTVNSCTSSRAAVTVTVNPVPASPTASSATICSGNTATLTATNPGGTYNWYDAASGGALLFTGASFATPNLTSTVTYYVDATSAAGCTSPRAAVTVTVNPIPSAPTASNATVCSGNTATLTATNPGGTYNWYNAASGGALLFTGASFATPNLTSTVTYYVDATSAAGCTSPRAAVTVTVNPIPSAPTASNATVCSGNTATLTATAPGGTYNWYDTASGGMLLFTGASFTTPNLTSTVTYYVDATSAAGCTGPRSSVTVTVNPIPSAPTALGATVCSGSNTTLTATGSTGSYEWFDAASGGALLSANASFTTPNLTSTTTYYVDATSAAGCTGERTAVTVTVNLIPAAPTAPGATVCSNTSATLTATAPGGTYNWYDAASGGTLLFTGASFATPNLTSTITYYVDATSAAGCTSPRSAVTVTVNPIPSAPTVAGATICSGNTATLTATAPGGSYEWFDAVSGGTLLSNNASFTTPFLSSTTTYYVQTTVNGCTSPRAAVTVTVNPIPSAPTALGATVCSGSNTTLTATGSTGSYEWFDAASGGALLSNNASFTTPNLTSTTTYYVQTTVNGCTSPRAAVTVTVNPIPSAPTAASATICSGNTATLTATAPGGTYNWYDAASGGTLLFTGASFATPNLTSTVTYYVDATSAAGCTSPRSAVTVTVNPIPSAPTASGATICSGNTATLTATAPGGTYNWYDAGGNLLPANGASFTTPNLTSTTTYYVDATTAAGCTSSRAAVTVTVNPIPASPTALGATICSGNTATLTATAPGGSYEWFDAVSGGTLLSANASFTTPNLTSTVTYHVQTTVNGCTSARTPVSVTVNPTPSVTSPANAAICNNTAQNYAINSDVNGATFTWGRAAVTGISNAAVSGQTSNSITETLVNTTNSPVAVGYLITPSANGCSGTPFTYTITVNPTPTVSSPANAAICNNTAQNYAIQSDVSGATFTWGRAAVTGINNPAVANQTSTSITEALANTTFSPVAVTYTITPSANSCTGQIFTYTITVNPTPTVSSPASATVCNSTAQNYAIQSDVNGATFTWGRAAVAGIGNAAVSGQTSNSITETLVNTTSGPVTVTYTITPVANGCTGSIFNYAVTILPATDPAFHYSSNTFCKTGTNPVPVTASTSGGTFSASPAGLVFADDHTGEINLSASTAGTYTVTYVTNTTCVYSSSSTISITNGPDAAFSYSGPYCQQQTNPLPTLPTGSTAGVFSSPGPGIVFVNSRTGEIDLQQSLPGTYTVRNDIAAAGGCAATFATATVTINPLPIVNAGVDQVVCSGQTVTLSGSIGGGASSAMWSGGTGTFSDPSSPHTIYTLGTGETSATLYLTTNDPAGPCGAAVDGLVITVNPTPSVTSLASAVICNNTAQNYAISSDVNGATYTWGRAAVTGISNAAVNGQTSSSITEALINTTYDPVTVTYSITPSANGCVGASFTYTISVNPTPTVTSPANAAICNGTSQNYAINSDVNGAGFTWGRAAVTGIGNAAVSGQTSNTITETLVNTTNSPVSVGYLITPSANGCTGASFTYTITVSPTPTITSPATATVCNGTAQNYIITSDVIGANFMWNRAAVTGISNAAVANQTSNSITEELINTTNSPVAVDYLITPSANGCTGASFTYTITVSPTPTLSNTSFSQVICSEGSSDPVTLTSNVSGANFTWTATATSGITGYAASGTAIIPAQTLANTALSAGTVTYTVTPFYNGCQGVTSIYTITVEPKPAAPEVGSNSPVCNGTSLMLTTTAVSGATYNWSGPNGFSSNQQNPQIANATSATQGVYSLTITVNGCTSSAGTTTVAVNPTPETPVAGSNTPVCAGETLSLTAGSIPGATYSWTGPNSFASSVQNPVVDNAQVAASGTYTVTATVNGCISPAGTVTIVVNAIPSAPTANSNSPVCAGSSINLTASGIAGANYSWTGPNGFTSALQNPVVPAATPANSGTYSVTASAGGCTSPASTVVVLVNPRSAEPVLTSNSPVCSGSPIQLTCTAYPDAVYQWTGPNGFTSDQQNPVLNNSTIASQGRYTVAITTPGCTVVNTAFIGVKVNPMPAAPVASSNSPLCAGQTLKLAASPVAGAIYTWTGPNGFASDLQNPEINHVAAEQAGSYFLTVTVDGCTSDKASTVVVVDRPATVFAGNNQTVCANNPVAISGSISGGGSGTWGTSGSGVFSAGNTSLKGTYLPSAADIANGTVTLTLTASGKNSCSIASSSFKLTIVPAPVVFAGNDQEVCSDSPVALNGKITNGNSGVWSSSGTGKFSPSNTSLDAVYIPSEKDKAEKIIALTLTSASNGNCTIAFSELKILFVPQPKVNAGQDIYVMQDERITLQPAATGTDLKYNWTPNLYLNNPTAKNPVLTGTEDITYTLTVTGAGGCVAQDQVFVKVLKPIIIPNTFTPNNDGTNDTWTIKELYNYPNVTVKIFNRYGMQLFYSQGYGIPWDGTYNGQPVPVGTYYYIIDLKIYGKLRSGPVTVIR